MDSPGGLIELALRRLLRLRKLLGAVLLDEVGVSHLGQHDVVLGLGGGGVGLGLGQRSCSRSRTGDECK
jgi:hypothetical protein